MGNQNSALGSLQPPPAGHGNAVSIFHEADDVQRFKDENAKWTLEEMIYALIAERLRLSIENLDLKYENDQMKVKQNVKEDTMKALQAENADSAQVIAVLESTNKKQLEMISTLKMEKETDRLFGNEEKKAFESEITRIKQLNADLEAKNKKHLEMISVLEKEKLANRLTHDAEKKALQGENGRLIHVIADLEAKYKNNLNKISDLEKQQHASPLVRGREKETTETHVTEMKQSHDPFEPLVVKKIVINESQNVWKCHSTLDGNEESSKLSLVDNALLVDGEVSQKKLILDGVVTQYETDPFTSRPNAYCFSRHHVCHLLSKVLSCNITDLFLHNQAISLEEFEKLVSSGTIKNLYFHAVDFKDCQADPVQKILENIPNIEKFAYYHNSNIKKVTFDDDKLPFFSKLLEFKLSKIPYSAFDVQSFFAFMKKYPNARFYLSFSSERIWDKPGYEKMKRMLLSHADESEKLQLKSRRTPSEARGAAVLAMRTPDLLTEIYDFFYFV